jgi:hypothetical protein
MNQNDEFKKGEYVTVNELADKLAVSVKFIRKHSHDIPGMLKVSLKVVRFHLPTIEKRLLSGRFLLPR